MVMTYVAVPEFITVHLGPPDSPAENVTVSFPEYIKNVASSEIYPTWPENALRANIYAQVTFALNRIYTEWYRSRGYPFDITSSTSYDQKFIKNRNVFENISEIVDDIFNRYVVRRGSQNPYFTEYCNGTTVTCRGLSQWGTVDLANQGMTPYEILQYYYGDDIDIKLAPILPYMESYPGEPLRLGDREYEVRLIQQRLNRIARNFPAIPRINPVDGVFGQQTENSVKAFQRVFNLTPDGIVGPGTWYKISFIYSSVRRLSELYGENEALSEVPVQYVEPLELGDSGERVRLLQYYINVLAAFYEEISEVREDGQFGEATRQQVLNFQRIFGLTQDGIVGIGTWDALYDAYVGILRTVPQRYFNDTVNVPNVGQYPGYNYQRT
ncbi:MAG: peptidoglycan-binding protein [Oscillospiraceae bacterium]|nr:peptidoglycan-binding protein [Oscillospiraceae bacterium]